LSRTEMDSIYAGAAANYQLLCASCHGRRLEAFVDREWENGHDDDYIQDRIRNGDIKDGMPSFDQALSDEEIRQMSDYINSGIVNLSLFSFDKRPDVTSVFESEKMNYRLEVFAEGLEIPWGMAFLPGAEMLITDRNGKMMQVSPDGSITEIRNVPEVLNESQGGLLDIEPHPEFNENRLIYFSYSIFRKEGRKILSTTAIARAVLNGESLEDINVIFEALPYSETRHHYGSRIEFDNKGYLYFSVGDRGNREENPQALDNHCGKIHRLHDDGQIPDDNPFVNVEGALPSIYSYGHRNPQGLIKHPVTGEIWSHEHGPRGGDEINKIKAGLNYGWPVISYGINYDGTIFTGITKKEGMEQPLHYWAPSIAPCGMDFITSDKYPGWSDNLMVGSLRFEYLHRCELRDEFVVHEELLLKNIGRLRNIKQGPDGFIYIGVENPGTIYKLIPVQ